MIKIHTDLLVKLRNDRDLNQAQFSKCVGIPLSTLKQIELGKLDISEERLQKVCEFFEIEPEKLIKRDDIVLSVMLHKGGCGKTTTCVNTAFALAKKGKKILIIDTDMQKNLTLQMDFEEAPSTFFKVLKGEMPITEAIIKTQYENIDLITSSEELAMAETWLLGQNFRERKVINALKPIRGLYDFIMLDTAPGLGLLNACIMLATDYIIMPVVSTEFNMSGLNMFLRFFSDLKTEGFQGELLGVVMNDVDMRKEMTKSVFKQLQENFGDLLFDHYISTDQNIDNAQRMHTPLQVSYPTTRAAKDYKEFADELLDRIFSKKEACVNG